jgi:hypothetical protein
MKRKSLFWIGFGTAAGVAFTRWQMARWFAEQPEYEVEDRVGPLEIRHYDRVVRAETTVEARSWDDALNEGFRRLAGYIFGANRPRGAQGRVDSTHDVISMTAPVNARPQKIPMTAPVNVRTERHALANLADVESGANSQAADASFTVTFTMPKNRTGGSLPVPEDSRVRLRSVPPRRVAVLRYTGRYSARRVAEKSRALLQAVQAAGLRTRGEPEFAGYDPPSTLPWLRRNEVWIELGSPTAP